jgi:ATP:ADP antiporter, AAA family
MSTQINRPAPSNFLEKITGARANELSAAALSFAYFFCLLASYYVLRPIRDEMAVQIGKNGLAEIFTYVFFTMLAVMPIFGWLMARFPRKKLLVWMYVFFALNLVGFNFYFSAAGQQTPFVARVFYVWVSVYNLFVISVFWSFMADLFSSDQAKRIYGFVAAGGTIGALAGPIITVNLVSVIGAKNLLLVSAVFLVITIGLIQALVAWEKANAISDADKAQLAKEEKPMGGSIWAGIRDVITDPYLLAICAFLFLYALLSSLLYFAQIDLLPKAIPNSTERIELLAKTDLAVNIITLAIQLLAFGKLMTKLGPKFMLVSIPMVSIIGFIALAVSPVLTVLLVFGVLRRAGEYAVSKPARETLFNVLPTEQKYKAKNVIDTLVHRTGDVSSTWIITLLSRAGISLQTMSTAAVPLAIVWTAVAWWLGSRAIEKSKTTFVDQ